MCEPHVLIAPLPQLDLPPDVGDFRFSHGVAIGPFPSALRRGMLDVAKAADCHEDVLDVLIVANTVAYVTVPCVKDQKGFNEGGLGPVLYRAVAEALLGRIYDSLLLFQNAPSFFWTQCWFTTSGSPGNIKKDALVLLMPEWQHERLFSCEGCSLPGLNGLREMAKHWPKLSDLFQIDRLVSRYADSSKWAGYMKAGNARTRQEAERIALEAMEEREGEGGPDDAIHVTGKMAARTFFKGFISAFTTSVEKEDQGRLSQRRLVRAIQIFADGIQLPEPIQFLAVTSSLEALLSSSNTDLTFQLSSRLAWLLHPESPEVRCFVFENMKDIYQLRSKIAHGDTYSPDTLSEIEPLLHTICRQAFQKILQHDGLFEVFSGQDQKKLSDILSRLSLGILPPPRQA